MSEAKERPSDRQRILDLLLREGSVDSFRLRREGYSGNPSQRIRELRNLGYQIEAERFRRDDGRAGVIYTLIPPDDWTLFRSDQTERKENA